MPVAERTSRRVARADDGSTPSRITCEWCGKKLTGRQRRFCCREHDELQSGRRKVGAKRVCPVDGVLFETAGNKRFCSDRCGKAYDNAKRRGTLDQLLARGRVCSPPYYCARCGRHCVPGKNVAPQATRFCDAECKKAWHSHHVEGHGSHTRPARCLVLVDRDPRRIAWWRAFCGEAALDAWGVFNVTPFSDDVAYRRALRRDPCAYCSAPAAAVDHIEPRCAGGADVWENRTATCHECNSLKGPLPLLAALLFIPAAREYHSLRRTLFAA